MSDDDPIDLDEFDSPERPDFRRIGKGIPYVVGLDGKRKRYSRSSKAGDILDDEYNLWDWKLRTVVVGATKRPELLAMASTVDPTTKAGKKALRDIVEDLLVAGKGSQRSIQGTAIHAMFDHLDRGDDWDPAPQFLDVCNAYLECLTHYGLIVEAPDCIEIHCVNDEFGLAGSADRVYCTTKPLIPPDGQLMMPHQRLIGDTKTGDTLEYTSGTYACQLAAYADSMRYDVTTDERTPFDPPVNTDWAVILHARYETGTCELKWVDLNAGREGLRLARQVKAWRKRTGLIVDATPPLNQGDNYADQQIEADAALAGVPEMPAEPPTVPAEPREAPPAPEMADAVRAWLRGRVVAIREHGGPAVKALQLAWPPDVPGLKQEGHSAHELAAIEKALDQVETQYSLPFGATDPRKLERHPSTGWSTRWAQPKADDVTPDEQAEVQRQAINAHPRRALLQRWVSAAVAGGIDSSIDTYALSNALYEFANLDVVTWPDDDLTEMLDGCMRALGYANGIADLGKFNPEDAPKLMAAAFAIAAGTVGIWYDDDGKPTTSIPIS